MSPSPPRPLPAAICASIAPRRRRRASRWRARICGRRRARRCSRRSRPRRGSPKRPARKSPTSTLPPILEEAYAAQFIIQDYENIRALAFEYDRHRDRIGKMLREQLDRAARDLRRRLRRGAPHREPRPAGARRRHGGLRRDPHAVGAGRRAARPRRDRRSDVQPAVDADGRALRQRAGLERQRTCRSACRSSAASAATAPRSKRRCLSSGRSRTAVRRDADSVRQPEVRA